MVLNCIQAHVDGSAPAYTAQFRMRHKDGSYRQIVAHGVASRDAGGRAVRMAGSHVELVAEKTEKAEKLPGADVASSQVAMASAAPEVVRRQGLWESWSPLEQEQQPTPTRVVTEPAPADAALPSINPHALR